jgi:hypothetical protein
MEFTLTENFELLPGANAANFVSPTVSKSDPIELSMVQNKLSSDQTFSVDQSTNQQVAGTALVSNSNKPLVASGVSHEDVGSETFFERVLAGAEKYGPLIARGAKLLGSIL